MTTAPATPVQPGVNVAHQLSAVARAHPGTLAVAVQRVNRRGERRYDQWTALELEVESSRIANGLSGIGIGSGVRTVLMVKPSIEFFALTFALFKTGAVPVFVDPGMGLRNLGKCLAEARPEAFIGIPKAHAARILLGWARGSLKKHVWAGSRAPGTGISYNALKKGQPDEFAVRPSQSEDMAAILFTSGSTGVPKGVVYTHAIFNAQVESLRSDYGIQPGEIDIATFPLFALFGPALGMAAVVPEMDASRPVTADPENIIGAANDFGATNLFASPALIDKVGRYGEAHKRTLPTLRRVISAGAPAEPESLARFGSLLDPDARILTSYGATEALPVSYIDHRELIDGTAGLTDRGAGVCVGRPVNGIAVRIVRITDDPIPRWSEDLTLAADEIGEICVSGPVVTDAYYERPEATRLAKIAGANGDVVWHRMGDLGYLDDQDRLWFCGRKAHRVVTDSSTLYTIPCERVFNVHPAVRRTALVGLTRDDGTRPVLCVELNRSETASGRDEIRKELLEIARQFEHTRPIQTILFHPRFPVDVRHNAKIFREQLAVWAARRVK